MALAARRLETKPQPEIVAEAPGNKAIITKPTRAPATVSSDLLEKKRALTPLVVVSLVAALALIAVGASIDGTSNAGHFAQKWLIFSGIMAAIAGWLTIRTPRLWELFIAAALICWTLAAFAIYAGIYDEHWGSVPQAWRTLVAAVGGGLLGLGAAIATIHGRLGNYFAALTWLWGLGWVGYFVAGPYSTPLFDDPLSEYALMTKFAAGWFLIGGGAFVVMMIVGDIVAPESREKPWATDENAPPARSQWAGGKDKYLAAVNLDEE